MMAWMVVRAATQAVTVVLLARQLGAQAYGQVVAVVAVASFLVPFAGLGLSHLVLRNVARDPEREANYVAHATYWWVRTLLPCIVVAIATAGLLLPGGLSIPSVIGVLACEIAAASLTELRARHRQAQQNIHACGAINAGLPFFRLLALSILFLAVAAPMPSDVLWAYTGSALAYLLLLLWGARGTQYAACRALPEIMGPRAGLSFALSSFSMRLQAEFNKPILAQSAFTLAGSYNVAQRAVELASLPLLALQEALWPRLYAQQEPMRQLRSTGSALFGLSLALGVSIWAASPLLPLVFGASFEGAVPVLRALAWLPMIQVLRALLNFVAIHHGQMQRIAKASIVGAIVGVISVATLVPTRGMMGAAISTYLTELVMISLLLAGSLRARQKSFS